MTQSTNKSSSDEPNGSPVSLEQCGSTSRRNSPSSGGSDNDGSEKPIREKLKKASIAGLSTHAKANGDKVQSGDANVETSAREEEEDEEKGTDRGDTMLTDNIPSSRGRPARKRSFDDLQNESTTNIDMPLHDHATGTEGHHKRMRSRDMSVNNKPAINGKVDREQVEVLAEEENDIEARNSPGGAGVMVEAHSIDDEAESSGNQSPKKKRSRDQFDKDHHVDGVADLEEGSLERVSERERLKVDEEATRTTSISDKGEPEKKRYRDASQERKKAIEAQSVTTKVEKSSGFANTSTVSPFGALASPKSPSPVRQISESEVAVNERQKTSSSAFASSGLSAFASSSKSPFGNLNSSAGPGSGSGFGSFGPQPSGGFGSSSNFGGASPFATKAASGFGGLGVSGFGSAWKSGAEGLNTGLSRFPPAGGPSGVIGSGSISKPFGTSEDDDENKDENDDAASSRAEDDADERDSRFYEQPLETGEEEEETMFSCRAKLFHFEKEWKERGVGTIKLNVHNPIKEYPGEIPEQRARLIMRTDGVHRVVLNTPIFKGMRFGTPDGKEPTGKTLNLTGMENGKPTLFLLRIGKEDSVKDLYHRISVIHDALL